MIRNVSLIVMFLAGAELGQAEQPTGVPALLEELREDGDSVDIAVHITRQHHCERGHWT